MLAKLDITRKKLFTFNCNNISSTSYMSIITSNAIVSTIGRHRIIMRTVKNVILTTGALEPTLYKRNICWWATAIGASIIVSISGSGESQHFANNVSIIDIPTRTTDSIITEWAAIVINISAIMTGIGSFQGYPSWVVVDIDV